MQPKTQKKSSSIKKTNGYSPLVLTRHSTHFNLRKLLPKLPFRTVIRLGSTTVVEDAVSKGGNRIEINEIKGVKNSANKLLMKQCFTNAGIPTPDWYTSDKVNFYVQGKKDKIIKITELKFPLIVKSLTGSRGVGNHFIETVEDLKRFITGHDMQNYIIEKYLTGYNKELRIHVTEDGYFYTCRKLLKNDTPKEERYQRHDDNCTWILESNPKFDKPVNFDNIVVDCIKALKYLELSIAAFDIKCQTTQDGEGKVRKNPLYAILESCSAPSFGNVTEQKYLEQIPILAYKQAKKYGIYNKQS